MQIRDIKMVEWQSELSTYNIWKFVENLDCKVMNAFGINFGSYISPLTICVYLINLTCKQYKQITSESIKNWIRIVSKIDVTELQGRFTFMTAFIVIAH